MDIYNLLGEKINSLVNEIKSAGEYNIKWNANNLESGIYFCRLEVGSYNETRKVVLLK